MTAALARAARIRELGMLVAILLTVVLFSLTADDFARSSNLGDIARNAALVAVVGIGQTLVILTRNIDLSVGSIVGLSAFGSASVLEHAPHTSLLLIVLLAVGIGVACGIVNGILVVGLGMPAIVATIATLFIYRGVLFEASSGQNIEASRLPDAFLDLPNQSLLGLPLPFVVALAVGLVAAFGLRYTAAGRNLYAIGSSPEAARAVGIRSGRHVFGALVASGAAAGLGGVMLAAQFGTVNQLSGTGLELAVIAAAVIGGVRLAGGSGAAAGAILGALLVETIANGFTILRLNDFWVDAFTGTAIVVAIGLDALITRRQERRLREARHAAVRSGRAEVRRRAAGSIESTGEHA